MVESKPASRKRMQTRQEKRVIFYILMFVLPLLQFAIFYLYVNFNSFMIAFQKRTSDFKIVATSDNFVEAFTYFFSAKGGRMMWNSFQLLACQILIATPLGLLFSYYIAKEKKGAGFFRIMLYLPQVLSMVVLAALFKFVVNKVYPIVAEKYFGNEEAIGFLHPTASPTVKFYAALVFTMWFSFGANVLIYTGAMSGIDQSIVESASLDGVNTLQEFWYIYVPIIFPTITTFLLTSLAGMFNNQMSLHLFFGNDGNVDVFAYYFYCMAAKNTTASQDQYADSGFVTLGELAALGLIATALLVPVTLLTRKGLQKWGPKVD